MDKSEYPRSAPEEEVENHCPSGTGEEGKRGRRERRLKQAGKEELR
jgi:hypothetical protein